MGQAAANDAHRKDWIREGWLKRLEDLNRLHMKGEVDAAFVLAVELERDMREYVNRTYEY